MSAKSVVGYAFLFIFLFLLIPVHSGFILSIFIVAIIVIIYKVKQNRGFERQYSKTRIKKNSSKSTKSDERGKQAIIDTQRDNDAVLYNSKGEILKELPPESTESDERSNDATIDTEKDDDAVLYNSKDAMFEKFSSKNTESDEKDKPVISTNIENDSHAVLYNSKGEMLKELPPESTESSKGDNDAIVYNTDGEIFENPNSQNTIENQRRQKIQDDWERHHYGETGKRNAFDKNYWKFHFDEGIISKKGKFLEAIEICEKNDLGSKTKIRRFKKKIDRWNVENERDIGALMPDYEYILDLIEKSETSE